MVAEVEAGLFIEILNQHDIVENNKEVKLMIVAK